MDYYEEVKRLWWVGEMIIMRRDWIRQIDYFKTILLLMWIWTLRYQPNQNIKVCIWIPNITIHSLFVHTLFLLFIQIEIHVCHLEITSQTVNIFIFKENLASILYLKHPEDHLHEFVVYM